MLSFKKNQLFKNWNFRMLLPVIGMSFVLSGCLEDRIGEPLPPAAYVLFYHASPESPSIDVHVNGHKITQNPIDYSWILPYQRFYTGKRNFKFTPPNAISSMLDTEVTLEEDKVYSIFLVDEVNGLNDLVVVDDWEDPDSNHAGVRFIHLSPDAGEIVVEVNNGEKPFGPMEIFKDASEFEEFDKGKYNFKIKSKETGEVLVTASEVEIKGNRIYTLILRGEISQDEEEKNLNLQLLTNHVQF